MSATVPRPASDERRAPVRPARTRSRLSCPKPSRLSCPKPSRLARLKLARLRPERRRSRIALVLAMVGGLLLLIAACAGPASAATPAAPKLDDPVQKLVTNVNSGGASPLTVVLLLGVVSLVPALLMMVTAFTRIVIVLGFTRQALGAQQIPPNQVIIGLSLFLTLFVMGPTFTQVNHDAVQPMLKGQITTGVAFQKAQEPFKTFMLKQVREKDLGLFVKLSGKPQPRNKQDISIGTLVPAFVLSELRTAFLIGFVIFLPFLVIDFVVSAALSSMGMMMLPPVLISLPFKLLLFVAADGWYLVVSSLVRSFHT